MRVLLLILFLGIVCSLRAQSRIAADLNSAFDNFFTSLLYCHVFKGTYYVKTGISAGNFGFGEVWKETDDVVKNGPLVSPHAELNDPPYPNMQLAQYVSKNKGQGIEVGVGKFWELDPIHTLRLDFQAKAYHLKEVVWAHYLNVPDTATGIGRYEFTRNCLSLGPEIFHAIRMSGHITFYYGLKFPFFLPVRTKQFQPQGMKDPTVGFQPNLTIGLSCALEKRKKETP